ncbi:unnamed protein product [Didymodactylos carnosus]|uniref:Poly [ADP-ribose] polymerase n=1 Tax=Didymodactylos carnosus TaxID=1234261 RepID=A0A8S2HLD6_9BILA|nr:unnamed protein product [Didymodactylos carnosus]CAF3663633.1 unnamed protein product [Didymodactylos carnosus]
MLSQGCTYWVVVRGDYHIPDLRKVIVLCLSQSLTSRGIKCYTECVRKEILKLSPSLFHLQSHNDDSYQIILRPKIQLCRNFTLDHFLLINILQFAQFNKQLTSVSISPRDQSAIDFGPSVGPPLLDSIATGNDVTIVQWQNQTQPIPTTFQQGTNRGCRIARGNTRVIQNRITHTSFDFQCGRGASSNRRRPRRSRRVPFYDGDEDSPTFYAFNAKNNSHHPPVKITQNIEYQLDIVLPGEKDAPLVDKEIVELILTNKGFRVQQIFNEINNDIFRRFTVELETKDSIDKLLIDSFLRYGNIEIKLKRTLQPIDKYCFILKIIITDKRIDLLRLELYIDMLIENKKRIITDITNDRSKQIFLINCEEVVDFNKLHKLHSLKNKLQNNDVVVGECYESDTILLLLNEKNTKESKLFTLDLLKQMFLSLWSDIFMLTIDKTNATIELMNSEVLKQWISRSDEFEKQFGVLIKPVLHIVEDDINSDTKLQISIDSRKNLSDTTIITPVKQIKQLFIILKPNWMLVLTHSTFLIEYKQYIKINDSRVTNKNLNSKTRSQLSQKTNIFMQMFDYKQLQAPSIDKLNLLKENSFQIFYQKISANNSSKDIYKIIGKRNIIQRYFPYLYDLSTSKRQIIGQKQEQERLAEKLVTCINDEFQTIRQTSLSLPIAKDIEQSKIPSSSLSVRDHPPNRNIREIEKKINPITVAQSSSIESIQYSIETHVHVQFFSIKLFQERFQNYLQGTFNVKSIIKRHHVEDEQQKQSTSRITIIISDEWAKMPDSAHVIQHLMNSRNILCHCIHSKTSLTVYFFHRENAQFGVDETRINEIIRNVFLSATTSYQTISSSKLEQKWEKLKQNIRNRQDYNKNICFISEYKCIYLFGLTDIVKELHSTFENLKIEHEPKLCKLSLNPNQINYLLYICNQELKLLDREHRSEGVKIMLKLRNNEILAPLNMHENLKLRLLEYAQVVTSTFEINDWGFSTLITKSQLIEKAHDCRCFLDMKIETTEIPIKIPTSHVTDDENIDVLKTRKGVSVQQTKLLTSIPIEMGTISVYLDDLITRKDDIIVVCSTSEILRNAVIVSAGKQVATEFSSQYVTQQNQLISTSPGMLGCKKILFIPWLPQIQDPVILRQSISLFVSEAVTYACANNYTSIAFPAIGCGKFGIAADIIAETMIHEAEQQLSKHRKNMSISFVLLPEQQSVYNEFLQKLNKLKIKHINQTLFSIITPKTNVNLSSSMTMMFEQQVVKITLTSSNEINMTKCRHIIQQLSKNCSSKLKWTDKHDLKDWSQLTVNKYYQYCLRKKILPNLDIEQGNLELNGPKDSVDQAEKYYYELVADTLKTARKQAIEINEGEWEQYSYKLNAEIEDAYQKKLSNIDLTNEHLENIRIHFTKDQMNEEYLKRIRLIRRKQINQNLPDNWEVSDVNCRRIQLQSTTSEYASVLSQFNVTMIGHYSQILKIERIQNERWFKQYAAHRDEFDQRYNKQNMINEKLLFHGCPNVSADKIIQECFNRSFAGINGVVYGCGVYFSENARYSHEYSRPNLNNERTMFLARVLIGQTAIGNQGQKFPPPGCDTTTDGKAIFVVYHDAAAYADYLISYR